MASNEELACVYSSLILQDGEVPITADKLQAILKAADVQVESYWPGLFAKACETLNLKDLVTNVGSGAGAAAAPVAAAAGGAAEEKEEKKEAKKEEEEEEEDDDMGFGLFDWASKSNIY